MAHGNGIGSTPSSPSSTHFPATVDTTAAASTSRPGTPSQSRLSKEHLPLAGAPPRSGPEGDPSLSRVSTGTRRRASLESLHSPALRGSEEAPGAQSGDVVEMQPVSRQLSVRSLQPVQQQSSGALSSNRERGDIESAMDHLSNQALPQNVDSPARLWDYVKAALPVAAGGGVGAAITFGAFRGVGSTIEHTVNPEFGQQVLKQMEAVLIGAGLGGVGNTVAAAAAAPAAIALMSKTLGTGTKLAPADAELMVPHDAPNRSAQIEAIRTAQDAAKSQYAVDSWRNIAAGILSFGGLNAVRGAVTANAGLSAGAGYAVAILTSLLAGALTPILMQALQANSRIEIEGPDGKSQSKLLFKPGANPTPDIGAAVEAAMGTFNDGREGLQQVAHVISQVTQRMGIVGASTVGYGLIQSAIPAVREELMKRGQSREMANMNANAMMDGLSFIPVVICYFTLLGKLAGTLPQRNRAPATDEPAEPASAPR